MATFGPGVCAFASSREIHSSGWHFAMAGQVLCGLWVGRGSVKVCVCVCVCLRVGANGPLVGERFRADAKFYKKVGAPGYNHWQNENLVLRCC